MVARDDVRRFFSEAETIVVDLTAETFEQKTGRPLTDFAHDCHAAAVAIVRSGALGRPCRVARGFCPGVGGQHSWVVVGMDCYDENAIVVDPTLWSYDRELSDREPYVFVGRAHERPHTPHGDTRNIFAWGRPDYPTGPAIELDRTGLSWDACAFLDLLGPLDRKGWAQLAHAPIGGWPAGEIYGAMWRSDTLGGLVPIDLIGMLTDINPGGLYLPVDDEGSPS